MSLRYLLDTSVVSVPVSKRPNPQVLRRIRSSAGVCAIAGPVWQELNYGYRRLPNGKRRTFLETYLYNVVQATIPILPYDEHAAAWHGKERARLEAEGHTAPFVDGQIAAVARVNDLVLVTLNEKDFVGFSGLVIENWAVAQPET